MTEEELRAQIASFGVPQKLLRAYENAVAERTKERCRKDLDAWVHRAMDSSNESMQLRLQYGKEQERAQKQELFIKLLQERSELAKKALGKMAAHCRTLRAQVFGDSSERGASQTATVPAAAPANTGKPKRGKRKGAPGAGRKPDRDPEDSEPVHHDFDPSENVCRCGGTLEDTDLPPVESFETDFQESVEVKRHLRRKAIRRCPKCGKKSIKTAKLPPKLIPKGKYSTSFWRFIIEEKFRLQRPLNRICTKFRSLDIIVRPGTLNNGLQFLYKRRIFEVIYEAIVDRSRLAEQRHMDETGWKVFAETENKHSHRWYMWVSVTSDTIVFILDPRRSNEVIGEYLHGVPEGIIICDRHGAYGCFARKNGFIIAYCWIHQRRDFIDLKTGYPIHTEWADSWLVRIDALIAQNKVRVAALSDPDQFKAQDAILRKMIAEFQSAIEAQQSSGTLAPEQFARLESLKNHWNGLTVFVDYPNVPMSNNEAERALRDAVLGRKSYYGNRAIWSGMLTAQLFTIYETLEKNNIDPRRWMQEYLDACAANNGYPLPDKDLKKYFPWNLAGNRTDDVVLTTVLGA